MGEKAQGSRLKAKDPSSPDSFTAASKEQKTDVETQNSILKYPRSSIEHPASSDQRPVPIIAITASAFGEQRDDILSAGCDEMVIKPFQEHEIFETMGRLLDIEYIYEPKSEAVPVRVPEVEITAAMLADLPDGLLQELREATLALNREAALEEIARIEGRLRHDHGLPGDRGAVATTTGDGKVNGRDGDPGSILRALVRCAA